MLSSEHLNQEIKKIDDILKTKDLENTDPLNFANLKCLTLLLKLLHSIRTNQTLIMEKQGVAKIKPITSINKTSNNPNVTTK